VIKISPLLYGGQKDDFGSNDEARYNWQMDRRASSILIGDDDDVMKVRVYKHSTSVLQTDFNWIQSGELIAGSFMSGIVHNTSITHGDVDIYFKSKTDADLFCTANPKLKQMYKGDVAAQLADNNTVINLIFGVSFDSPEELISRFDIRACSIALDPNTNTTYALKGAAGDCAMKRIVFNPNPHNTTVARLVKYVEKGFVIDAYQRLFFAELLKGTQYRPDLELTTGYRAVVK
jgi:hypothetical protein